MSEQNQPDQRNLTVAINHKHFTISLIEVLDIINKKSEEVQLEQLDLTVKQNLRLHKNHTKLRAVCKDLKRGFSSEEENDFDQGRIIKKIYKVLTQHLDKLYPEPTIELFSLKNEKKEIVTIIPGLDISVVAKDFNDTELTALWGHLYMLFISAVGMISSINGHKKEGKVWEILPKLREKVTKMGLTKDGKMFNPFIGLMQENGEYNVETMFENVDELKTTGPSVEDVFKLTGVDKLVDVNQLNDQLKNVKQEDIDEATRNITKLLGAENDSDINEVCGSLVEGIVEDLKSNKDGGLKSMFDTAKAVTEKIGSKLDRNKMQKTALQLSDFLKNGENNLKNMRDDKGNPIGEKIMKSLELPLKLAQSMEGGGNAAKYQEMMRQVNNTVANELAGSGGRNILRK